jgi:hypothetical protein
MLQQALCQAFSQMSSRILQVEDPQLYLLGYAVDRIML